MALEDALHEKAFHEGAILAVRDIKTKFSGQVIHDGISFDLQRGEIFCIVGGSGSGKSVLLRFIIGLDEPQHGKIIYRPPYSRKKIGVLFQSGALLSSLTVLENVMLPMRQFQDIKTAEELAFKQLEQMGLEKRDAEKYPAQLSGGMIKRVGLARALILKPPFLCLDEPTAGLDPLAAQEFDNLLLDCRKKMDLTVLMITHDLDTLHKTADRIGIILDHKMTSGTVSEVTHNPTPWIQHYFHGERGKRLFG